MFDEMERLRDEKDLFTLLSRYAALAAADRSLWQDRLREMDGVEGRQLVRLHGELLAYGWLEQNTGLTPVLRRGEAPACYRITPAGLRALKQLRQEQSPVGVAGRDDHGPRRDGGGGGGVRLGGEDDARSRPAAGRFGNTCRGSRSRARGD